MIKRGGENLVQSALPLIPPQRFQCCTLARSKSGPVEQYVVYTFPGDMRKML